MADPTKSTTPAPGVRGPGLADKPGPNTITCENDGRSPAAILAEMVMRPSLHAAVVVKTYPPISNEGMDVSELLVAVNHRIHKVAAEGDMTMPEAMLMGQAESLQAIFTTLATTAQRNLGASSLRVGETYLRLALKAQAQCRATLETLAAIKNPTAPIFARQANIANGPQQVNNGTPPPAAPPPAGARQIENRPNEILEIEPCQPEPVAAGATSDEPDRQPASASGDPGNPTPGRARRRGRP